MESRRAVLRALLTERRQVIPRPARLLLTMLLEDDDLLSRMHFCQPDERTYLRNSLLIATEETACWAVLLGNTPGSAGHVRARLVLEGLNLSPGEITGRLRSLPVWFLAIDAPFAAPVRGQAAATETTAYRLAGLPAAQLRRRALLDQIDAALADGNFDACRALSRLLQSQ